MNRSAKIWLALVVGAGASVLAYALPRRNPPPNIILITVDALRPDRLSAYGYDKHRTPNFDRLAREGVLFENAFCDVPWTIPSMASVMTGQYATRHGVRSVYQQLPPEMTTIAEILQARGTHTAAIVGSYPLHSIFGLAQGFELYDDRFSLPLLGNPSAAGTRHEASEQRPFAAPSGAKATRAKVNEFIFDKIAHDAYRPDDEVSTRAIQWLETDRQEPFFLWVHYFGPHEKPQPTGDLAYQSRMLLERYDPDVINSDEQLGRLLAALDTLGLSKRTAVILHADHGQSLGEHDYLGHGSDVHDPGQHIPLLVRFPGHIPAGRRVHRMVRNVDLLPTIAELAGAAAPQFTDGASLVPLMRGEQPLPEEDAYIETYLPATFYFSERVGPSQSARLAFRRLGVRTPRWKLIINDPVEFLDRDDPPPVTADQRRRYYSEELYDLSADPNETRNVIEQQPEIAKVLRGKVMEYQQAPSLAPKSIELDESSRDRLRSLGYPTD